MKQRNAQPAPTRTDRSGTGSRTRLRLILAIVVLVAALPAAAIAPETAEPSPLPAASKLMRAPGNLPTTLTEIGALTRLRLRVPARELSRELDEGAERSAELGERATAVEAQLDLALEEMAQMRTTLADPHYMPALIAVGRAYLAASGRDPVSGFQLAPDYAGLAAELGEGTAAGEGSARRARKLSRAAGRVRRALAQASSRARALEREVSSRVPRARSGAMPGTGN